MSMNNVETVSASIKEFDASELMKVLKVIVNEMEKKLKTKVTKVKKEGSMPKGKVPPQLLRPRAWVEFTLKHAQENGWESFIVNQTKKDKETGDKTTEEIVMSKSINHNGVHVYEDSIDEKNPNGKKMIHKDAMSLSKQRWTPKDSMGTHKKLYEEFLEEFDLEQAQKMEENDESVESDSKEEEVPKKVDKEAEKEAKKAEKEAKKAEKEAEKAEKEVEKAEKKLEKVKPASSKAAKAAKVEAPVATPVKSKAAAAAPGAPVKAKKDNWSCPNDGELHQWFFNGESYLRNYENEVWKDEDGEMGEWCGVYIPSENRIDEDVRSPEFIDD